MTWHGMDSEQIRSVQIERKGMTVTVTVNVKKKLRAGSTNAACWLWLRFKYDLADYQQ